MSDTSGVIVTDVLVGKTMNEAESFGPQKFAVLPRVGEEIILTDPGGSETGFEVRNVVHVPIPLDPTQAQAAEYKQLQTVLFCEKR